jgi:hypothetical protein
MVCRGMYATPKPPQPPQKTSDRHRRTLKAPGVPISGREKARLAGPRNAPLKNGRASFALSCSVRWLAKLIKHGEHGVGAGNGRSELTAAEQLSAIRRRLVNRPISMIS